MTPQLVRDPTGKIYDQVGDYTVERGTLNLDGEWIFWLVCRYGVQVSKPLGSKESAMDEARLRDRQDSEVAERVIAAAWRDAMIDNLGRDVAEMGNRLSGLERAQ